MFASTYQQLFPGKLRRSVSHVTAPENMRWVGQALLKLQHVTRLQQPLCTYMIERPIQFHLALASSCRAQAPRSFYG